MDGKENQTVHLEDEEAEKAQRDTMKISTSVALHLQSQCSTICCEKTTS